MPDLMDPFYNAEDIIRMLLMFGVFGGCYIAEVLRGGLQAVDSGQKEAAIALGLSPFQTKMQVELPNAVRTTLPSIVSVFIGHYPPSLACSSASGKTLRCCSSSTY